MEHNDIIQQLSEHLFWDVEKHDIDLTKHQRFIITRVLDRGTSRDVRLIWSYYGEDSVKNAIMNAPSLQRKTISFFANQFQIPPEDFRAYKKELTTWDH
ncbi:MAG: hypothetical protein KAI74_00980 [Kiritimatiellae bacterium]|nr:hypothetical protein [Kiritimatiellia bacterium]